jgi:co-chaperonin GroES (HSP10)
MSHQFLEEGIKELIERAKQEKQSTTELVLDGSNKVAFPGFPYKFEALGKKIIVSIDVFRSGYECKICKGKGKIDIRCVCEDHRPGYKYSLLELKEFEGSEIYTAREMMYCPQCLGHPENKRRTISCEPCKGHGTLIEIPDTSKNLPTTGVVVSIGAGVKLEKIKYKVGDRVIFGPYAGSMIPTKAGLMFKVLDWNQVWCRIEGGEDLAAFDFVLTDVHSS